MPYQLDNNKLNKLDNNSKEMLVSAFNSLQRMELVQFFINYIPPPRTGYMYDDNPIIKKISEEINNDYGGHSGASMAFTLRSLKDVIIKT
jgi:hypothetical protein